MYSNGIDSSRLQPRYRLPSTDPLRQWRKGSQSYSHREYCNDFTSPWSRIVFARNLLCFEGVYKSVHYNQDPIISQNPYVIHDALGVVGPLNWFFPPPNHFKLAFLEIRAVHLLPRYTGMVSLIIHVCKMGNVFRQSVNSLFEVSTQVDIISLSSILMAMIIINLNA